MTAPLYVMGLRASNFMKVDLVELKFNGAGLEIVSGRNGEGKSSLLRAIWAALGGKGALPDQPVRAGQERAEVSLDLGDKVVRLRVKPDRTTTLTVEGKGAGAEGVTYRQPQRLLDEVVGALSFDPLAFASQDPRRQAETLRRLVGVDTSALDQERADVFGRRTDLGRQLRAADAQLTGMPTPVVVADVGQEVDIADLMNMHRDAIAAEASLERTQRRRDLHAQVLDGERARVRDLERQLAGALSRVADCEAALEQADAEVASAAASRPNLKAIAERVESAEQHNRAVRERRAQAQQARAALEARGAKQREVRDLADRMAALTGRLDEVDAEKARLLASAKFPLPGLGVEGEAVHYNGVPLAQCSSAEQVQVCLSVAAALNPTLRLILVRQGNDLDPERLRQVAEWARDQGYQVLMERVAGDQPAGIEIRAGRVVADHREKGSR